MIYNGRQLDVLGLWGQYVTFPYIESPLPTFLPKVVCPNPEHRTHKRHFQINTKQPLVHCFARCGIQGTYEHAISTILGVDEREARRLILRHTTVASPGTDREIQYRVGTRKHVEAGAAVEQDRQTLEGGGYAYLGKQAIAYLDGRGIDQPSRGKWRLGFSEDENRIIIPAYDENGTFRFLIKRAIEGDGYLKYLYTDGAIKTSLLFGACMLDRERVRSQGLVLCEGSLDVIRLHQVGVTNAVGILGTGLSKRQARIVDKISPKRIYLFFDRDPSGVSNIYSVKERLPHYPLFVVRYPAGLNDPADFTGKEAERALEKALPISLFIRKARALKPTKGVQNGKRVSPASRP